MKDQTGDLVKNAYFLNPIVSLKHYLSGLETTDWLKHLLFFPTFCCIIPLISGIIDHYCVMEIF